MAAAANQPPQVDKSAPALNGNVENLEDSQESSGVMSTLGVRVIQTIIFVYDFVTYPFYLAYQRPWNATNAASAIRAYPIEKTKDSITFQPIEKTCPEIEKFKVSNDSIQQSTFLIILLILNEFLISLFHRSSLGRKYKDNGRML